MPTYQYACTACDHAFEQVQSFTDDALTTCPQCEGRLRKIFNAVGVVFKGSGFYRTDSRTDSSASSTTNGSSSNGSSNGSSSTGTSTAGSGESSSSASSATKSEAGAA